MNSEKFVDTVWNYYRHNKRAALLWRQPQVGGIFDPYKIMVSEVMLQQTQVARVAVKYPEFLKQFPTVHALAEATLGDVLRVWQGLGYNRRAKYLWLAAQFVDTQWDGVFPNNQELLTQLPGIGRETAGAICAYAFNSPVVFVETNIRTVYIHHFFANKEAVNDKELRPLIEKTLDADNPREWYWALMDYGSFLKSAVGNKSKQSRHYTKQSKFEGSKRQIRGQVLALLSEYASLSAEELATHIADSRLSSVLSDLKAESLIKETKQIYHLA